MIRRDERRTGRVPALVALVAALLISAPNPVPAQAPFEPVAYVNNLVVTNFELEQRQALLQALRTPAVTRQGTLDRLIDDKLRLAAAADAGILGTEEELDIAVEDFAARANLSGPDFIEALGDAGIDEQSIRDFLRAQLAWNTLIQARFAAQAQVSEEEVDRALALSTGQGNARILVSEIVLPMTARDAVTSEQRAQEFQQITSFSEFEEAARRFSIGPTSSDGGRLDWLPVRALPPTVGPLVLPMRPGEVTAPVPLDGAIALFQLRQLQDVAPPPASNVVIDYALLRLPAGTNVAAEIARLAPEVDDCNSFFGQNPNAAPGQLLREASPLAELPSGVAATVRNLDPGELGALTGSAGVVMLCSRVEAAPDAEARDLLSRQLFVQRLESFSNGYLAELRTAADIRIP